jgi:hypothetical protein
VGRRLQITVIVTVVALLVAAVAAYAYDSSRKDELAEGVKIAGVDVGGLDAAEARALVDAEVVDPLRKPITVTFEDATYRLSPKQLEVTADLDRMVDRALSESQ